MPDERWAALLEELAGTACRPAEAGSAWNEVVGVLADYLADLGAPFAHLLRQLPGSVLLKLGLKGRWQLSFRVGDASSPHSADCDGRHLAHTWRPGSGQVRTTVYRDDGRAFTFDRSTPGKYSITGDSTLLFGRHLVVSGDDLSYSVDLFSGLSATAESPLGRLRRRGDLAVSLQVRTRLYDPHSLCETYACDDDEKGVAVWVSRAELPAGVGSLGSDDASRAPALRDVDGVIRYRVPIGVQAYALDMDASGSVRCIGREVASTGVYLLNDSGRHLLLTASASCRHAALCGSRALVEYRRYLTDPHVTCRCFDVAGATPRLLWEGVSLDTTLGGLYAFMSGGRYVANVMDGVLFVRDGASGAELEAVPLAAAVDTPRVTEVPGGGPLTLLVTGRSVYLHFVNL